MLWRIALCATCLVCWGWRSPGPEFSVRLISLQINADAKSKKLQLHWDASSNSQWHISGYFSVERSADGAHWQRVHLQEFFISPKFVEKYSYSSSFDEGYRYYRLRARDTSTGLEQVLGTTRVELTKALAHMELEPLPSIKKIYLSYILDKDRTLLVRVFDRIGNQLWTERLSSGQAGYHEHLLDFRKYGRGTYLLVITQVEDNLDIADYRIEWAP